MSRLVVVTAPELAVGYRLAGATTVEAGSPSAAETELTAMLPSETGVIAVHGPYFYQLSRPLRRRFESTDRPLVVPLPGGTASTEIEDRRDQLLQMLRQAVGYEITFDKDERTTP